MLVKTRSMLTGKEHTMDIPVDPVKLQAYAGGELSGLIQDVFPELNPDQREFLITGITPEEWDTLVAPPEDDE